MNHNCSLSKQAYFPTKIINSYNKNCHFVKPNNTSHTEYVSYEGEKVIHMRNLINIYLSYNIQG